MAGAASRRFCVAFGAPTVVLSEGPERIRERGRLGHGALRKDLVLLSFHCNRRAKEARGVVFDETWLSSRISIRARATRCSDMLGHAEETE